MGTAFCWIQYAGFLDRKQLGGFRILWRPAVAERRQIGGGVQVGLCNTVRQFGGRRKRSRFRWRDVSQFTDAVKRIARLAHDHVDAAVHNRRDDRSESARSEEHTSEL